MQKHYRKENLEGVQSLANFCLSSGSSQLVFLKYHQPETPASQAGEGMPCQEPEL